jgi:hypothetical protein
MDRITKSLLVEFLEQNDLSKLAEDTAFERFTGYLTVGIHYSESLDTEDISVGAGGDCGIDCLAIIVNGSLVTEPEEIEDLAETNGVLDVTFVFVQAERSSSFDTSKIGQFGFGVKDFFSERPSLIRNESITKSAAIVAEIFKRSSLFKRGNPACHLYYVTTGKWTGDQNLKARSDGVIEDLKGLGLFRSVSFDCVDAEGIQRLYNASKNAVTREIVFTERTVIPEIPNVDQAYLGFLPGPEFLKLIENEAGEIMSSIFYDNVRHWQEWNPVNTEIKDTLDNKDTKVRFPLMNNGVTIVARSVRPTGNRFTLEDYQIVNGCQTSYVLHECRDQLDASVLVPVRLIATQNEDVKNAVIKATNRQTQVTEDQLFALWDFPKKLEVYFQTFDGKQKLYYERRSRQYNSVEHIEKVRVVNMTTLVRAYASIFLERPHRTTRNYKALLKSVGTEIFGKDHKLEPYYLSAFANYRLEYMFRNQLLASDLKPARYHILLAFRMLQNPVQSLPHFGSREMASFCEKLLHVLWNDEQAKSGFEDAANAVRTVSGGNLHRDHIRTETFTDSLTQHLKPQ